jgi:hypothetical protein
MKNNTIVIEKIREVRSDILEEVLHKINILEELSKNIKHTDLKIHDVSYRLYSRAETLGLTFNQFNSLFQLICDVEYSNFEEWESENLSYVKREYIGTTSSFYYMSNWYGIHLNYYHVENLLKGNNVQLIDVLNGLESTTYDALINDILPIFDDVEEQEKFIEQLDDEYEFLSELNDDLDVMKDIIDEAIKAYNYLREYKTEENEYSIVDEYLQHEIEEILSESKANELFDSLMHNISPIKLNKVFKIKVVNFIEENEYEYKLKCIVNDKSFTLNTNIQSDDELSETYINGVMDILNELINHNFEL